VHILMTLANVFTMLLTFVVVAMVTLLATKWPPQAAQFPLHIVSLCYLLLSILVVSLCCCFYGSLPRPQLTKVKIITKWWKSIHWSDQFSILIVPFSCSFYDFSSSSPQPMH
jgi:hypothetical protein